MSADPKRAILGAWRLVHSVEVGPGGERSYPFEEDAIGYIIYAESGVMAVQISRRVRAPAGPEPIVGKKDYLACRRSWPNAGLQGLYRLSPSNQAA